MIKHIVVWRLKDKADAPRVKQEIESMRGRIRGLVTLEVGINFLVDSAAADVALYSEFEDRAAFDSYAEHPVHVPVKRFVGALVAERQVVDYEV